MVDPMGPGVSNRLYIGSHPPQAGSRGRSQKHIVPRARREASIPTSYIKLAGIFGRIVHHLPLRYRGNEVIARNYRVSQ